MEIVGIYPFTQDATGFRRTYGSLLQEVEDVLAEVDASACRNKKSSEKTMPGKTLYSPIALNRVFTAKFQARGWAKQRVRCEYSSAYFASHYKPLPVTRGAFREMDFVKERLGVEVQFGKYAFAVYNVCAKMTIFHRLGHIDAGVEIVPVREFAKDMSSGVAYFEQFVWDLQQRGVADIDIPVLVLGVR